TLQDFLAAAAFLLKQTGRFIAVYRAARFADLMAGMRSKNLEPKTIQLVHPRISEDATMVLVEGIKGAGAELKILPPLILYDACDTYTREVKSIFSKI
ncbi:MAG: SAM-dependent methyltransferase, partial [Pseudomonadota bacterium]